MKRTIAVCLMTVLILSLVLVSYAEKSGSTVIEYTVSDSYSFDIPSTVSINSGKLSVSVTDKISNDPVQLWLTSENYVFTDSGHFMLVHETNASSEIEYQLKYGEDVISNGTPFATFRGNGTAEITFALISSGPFNSGKYTDRITFHFG